MKEFVSLNESDETKTVHGVSFPQVKGHIYVCDHHQTVKHHEEHKTSTVYGERILISWAATATVLLWNPLMILIIWSHAEARQVEWYPGELFGQITIKAMWFVFIDITSSFAKNI